MGRPTISICVPCYNNAGEVERLLQSIYQQDYTDFEVNISDDSTDNATEILVRERYPLVKYQHNAQPYGHIFNWNAAIKMAHGVYIKIMFSDDWFTDKASLGAFAAMLDDNPDAVLAFSGSRQVMLDGPDSDALHHVTAAHRSAFYDRFADEAFIAQLRRDYRHLFLGNQIGAPSAVIYRRGSALTLFDERSNWASDLFLYFNLLEKSPIFAYSKQPLVSIGVHENQYTESFAEKDERIYNDYKYMYTKYNLRESRACKEYFAEQFLIKYHKGIREAMQLGIGGGLFARKLSHEFAATLQSVVESRFKKGHTENMKK